MQPLWQCRGCWARQGQLGCSPAGVPVQRTRARWSREVEVVSLSVPPAVAGWIFLSYLRR